MERVGTLAVVALVLSAGCAESHPAGVQADAATTDTATIDADLLADRVQFCTDKETYQCARDLAAGRIDMTQYNACAGRIDADCRGFDFPAGCVVTRSRADACIAALSDESRIATPSTDLPECFAATLCGP